MLYVTSWSLGRLQKQGPRLKLRNACKTAPSNLDSGTFRKPTNIRVKVREMERVRAKAHKERPLVAQLLPHWSTMS